MSEAERTALAAPRGFASSEDTPPRQQGRTLATLAVAGFGLMLLLVGYGFLSLVSVVALAAGLIPAGTAVRRAMFCVPALMGATSCLLTVAAVLRISLDARVLVAFALLLLTGLRLTLNTRSSSICCSSADRWALLAPVAAFCIIYRPYVHALPGERLALLSNTTDAGTHLALIRSSLLEGGYVTLVAGQDEKLLAGSQGYPPGLAGNLGLLLQLLVGRDPNLEAFISAAVPLLVGVYALLAWLGTWTTIAMVEAIVGGLSHSTAALTACTSAAAFIFGFNVLLWNTSAYAQLLATACVLAAVAVVLMPDTQTFATSILLALATVASVHSWYLLAPALAIPWTYHILNSSSRRRPVSVCVVLVAGAFSAFPVINGPKAADQLNAAGGVGIPAGPGLVAFLVLSLWTTWLLTTRCKSWRSRHLLVVVLLVSLLVLAVLVGAFQLIVTGAVQYYSAKVLYSAFVAGGIVIGAGAGVLWHRRAISANSSQRRWASMAALTLLLSPAIYGVLGAPSDVRGILLGEPAVNQSKLLQAAVASHPRGLPDHVDAWFGDDCRRGFDRIGSKALQDLSLTWTADREQMFVAYVTRRPGAVDPFRQRAVGDPARRVEVYVRSPCHPAALAALDGVPGVVVVRVP